MLRSHIKSLALILSVALLTSGCAVGFDAATNQQKASGNGRTANVGDIQVRNALIVRDKQNPTRGTFVGTIINSGPEVDEFIGLGIDPNAGKTFPNSTKLESQAATSFGLTGQLSLPIELKPSVVAGSFVAVQLNFAQNESIPMSLLVENNDGVYADVIVGSVIVD